MSNEKLTDETWANLKEILDDREELREKLSRLREQLKASGGRSMDEVSAENVDLKSKVKELKGQVQGLTSARRKEKKQIEALRKQSWDMNAKWVHALRQQATDFEARLNDLKDSIVQD